MSQQERGFIDTINYYTSLCTIEPLFWSAVIFSLLGNMCCAQMDYCMNRLLVY